MNKNISSKILISWWLLYCFYILFLIIAGIDKFFNYLVDWSIYINSNIPIYLNLSPKIFMYIFGIIEIIIGLLVLRKPKFGGYLVIVLFIAITVNLISMGSHHHEHYEHIMTHYDVALHDIGMIIGAYVFILLTKEISK